MITDRQFGEQPIVVGSAADCTLSLPDAQVSPRQVLFRPTGGGEWMVDVLDLRLPTRLNGATITQAQKIKDRDEIGLGRYAIKVYLTLDGRTAAEKPAATAAAKPVEREQPLPVGSLVRSHGGQIKLAI